MTASRRASLVRWMANALYYGGLVRPLSMAAGWVSARPAFPILCYHRVNDDADPFFPAVPVGVFERHMAYVARTFRVMTVEAIVERVRRGSVPRNTLAITFDDGYRDNLTHAAPILARHGLPATIYLATGLIGTAEVAWFDRMAMAFKTTKAEAYVTPWRETLPLATSGDRLRALDRMLGYFKRLPDDDMRRSVDGLLRALAVTDQKCFKNLMLTWDDVHALTGLGFAVGAHTVNHPILARVPARRAWTEIFGSRTMIESALGRAPKAFAYPNGRPEDYTATVRDLVREAGFTSAVSTRFGLNDRDTSPYDLRRGGPWERDVPTFALKLALYRATAAA
ncbi:MAG: polysaccharide deacetylase family protein [Candidatus Rokuibacteriota bacterium]